MNLKTKLEAAIGKFSLSLDQKKSKTTNPRDNVLKLITDNIKFHNDNNYTIKTAKGALKAPELCFEVTGDKARVWLCYSRQKLKLVGDTNVISDIDASKVVATLECLHDIVANGDFDDQLTDIKTERSAAQKGGKKRTPKK